MYGHTKYHWRPPKWQGCAFKTIPCFRFPISIQSHPQSSPCMSNRMSAVAICCSLDHLVGGTEQTCGQLDPERPCGLEIDHELNFGGACTGKPAIFSPFRIRTTELAPARKRSVPS